MNEEEKFDELLSSKLSERDFPFDELNWDEAERLIIQQEKTRKVTRFALIFSAGLAAGVFIMLPFIVNIHSTTPNSVSTPSTANQNTVAQKSVLPSATQSPANTNNPISKEEKASLPVQSAFVKKDTHTGIRNKSSNISVITKAPQKHPAVLVSEINKPRHTYNIPAQSNSIASSETNENEDVKTGSREKSNSNKNVTNASSQLSEVNPITANIKSPNTTISANKTSESDNNAPAPPPSTITDHTNKQITVNNNAMKSKKDTSNAITNSPPPILRPLNPDNPASSAPPCTNILSVYAGGNYSFGWINVGTVTDYKEGNGITPWGGFDFTHYFAGDFSASLGVGYSELNNLNETYANSLVQYDFGANSSITTVTPQTVYYLAFPFKLQWNLDTKNMFGLGINYLLMLTTSSTLTTYAQSYSIENNSVSPTNTPGTSQKQNGYTQGFNNSNMQLSISYTRMLTGRLGASLELYHDFDNVENNTVPVFNQYTFNQNGKNMGLRLVLSYQLMK